jgi:hypothetical protein
VEACSAAKERNGRQLTGCVGGQPWQSYTQANEHGDDPGREDEKGSDRLGVVVVACVCGLDMRTRVLAK